jgi:hypothetical protein
MSVRSAGTSPNARRNGGGHSLGGRNLCDGGETQVAADGGILAHARRQTYPRAGYPERVQIHGPGVG